MDECTNAEYSLVSLPSLRAFEHKNDVDDDRFTYFFACVCHLKVSKTFINLDIKELNT